MNKDKLLEELTQLAKSNNDIGKFGDGYEKAINEAIRLVKNCSIPDVVGQSGQLVCKHPLWQRDHYSDNTFKCWECKKIVGN